MKKRWCVRVNIRAGLAWLSLVFTIGLLAGCNSLSPTNPTPTQAPPPTATAPAKIAPTVAPTAMPSPTAAPNTRIQFQPQAVSWQTTGNLTANASARFVLAAQATQPLTVELTVTPDSEPGLPATIRIWGADNRELTTDPTMKWHGVLTVSQDYTIEIRSSSKSNITYTLLVAIPPKGSTPYVPMTAAVCQQLQELASQSLRVNFALNARAPFTDPITGETGQGCTLTAKGTGRDFANPGSVTAQLVKGYIGFTEQPMYQADGPTGSATAVTRDWGLVLIQAEWSPSIPCPANQPISACDLKPEQKLYTITIQAAMK